MNPDRKIIENSSRFKDASFYQNQRQQAVKAGLEKGILSRKQAHLAESIEEKKLPVSERFDELVDAMTEAFKARKPFLLQGETGSGKSILGPLAMQEAVRAYKVALDHMGEPFRVEIMQKLRAATNNVSKCLAAVSGLGYGPKYGVGQATADVKDNSLENDFRVATAGVLVRWMAEGVINENGGTALFLDEVHEGSVDYHIAFGIIKMMMDKGVYVPTVLASATLNKESLMNYFGLLESQYVKIEGRSYPLEIEYSKEPIKTEIKKEEINEKERKTFKVKAKDYIPKVVDVVLAKHLSKIEEGDDGDMMVFLPGVREIEEVESELKKKGIDNCDIYHFHSKVKDSVKDDIMTGENKEKGRRRIILCTNAAENGVTPNYVNTVIDSCVERAAVYNPSSGVYETLTRLISKDQADQRAGRAGRLGPGDVIRVISEDQFNELNQHPLSEIHNENLSTVILKLAKIGVSAREFPWFDPPSKKRIDEGIKELVELGALDENEKITEIGEMIYQLPFDARISRSVLESSKYNEVISVLLIGAFQRDQGLYNSYSFNDLQLENLYQRILNQRLSDEVNKDKNRVREIIFNPQFRFSNYIKPEHIYNDLIKEFPEYLNTITLDLIKKVLAEESFDNDKRNRLKSGLDSYRESNFKHGQTSDLLIQIDIYLEALKLGLAGEVDNENGFEYGGKELNNFCKKFNINKQTLKHIHARMRDYIKSYNDAVRFSEKTYQDNEEEKILPRLSISNTEELIGLLENMKTENVLKSILVSYPNRVFKYSSRGRYVSVFGSRDSSFYPHPASNIKNSDSKPFFIFSLESRGAAREGRGGSQEVFLCDNEVIDSKLLVETFPNLLERRQTSSQSEDVYDPEKEETLAPFYYSTKKHQDSIFSQKEPLEETEDLDKDKIKERHFTALAKHLSLMSSVPSVVFESWQKAEERWNKFFTKIGYKHNFFEQNKKTKTNQNLTTENRYEWIKNILIENNITSHKQEKEISEKLLLPEDYFVSDSDYQNLSEQFPESLDFGNFSCEVVYSYYGGITVRIPFDVLKDFNESVLKNYFNGYTSNVLLSSTDPEGYTYGGQNSLFELLSVIKNKRMSEEIRNFTENNKQIYGLMDVSESQISEHFKNGSIVLESEKLPGESVVFYPIVSVSDQVTFGYSQKPTDPDFNIEKLISEVAQMQEARKDFLKRQEEEKKRKELKENLKERYLAVLGFFESYDWRWYSSEKYWISQEEQETETQKIQKVKNTYENEAESLEELLVDAENYIKSLDSRLEHIEKLKSQIDEYLEKYMTLHPISGEYFDYRNRLDLGYDEIQRINVDHYSNNVFPLREIQNERGEVLYRLAYYPDYNRGTVRLESYDQNRFNSTYCSFKDVKWDGGLFNEVKYVDYDLIIDEKEIEEKQKMQKKYRQEKERREFSVPSYYRFYKNAERLLPEKGQKNFREGQMLKGKFQTESVNGDNVYVRYETFGDRSYRFIIDKNSEYLPRYPYNYFFEVVALETKKDENGSNIIEARCVIRQPLPEDEPDSEAEKLFLKETGITGERFDYNEEDYNEEDGFESEEEKYKENPKEESLELVSLDVLLKELVEYEKKLTENENPFEELSIKLKLKEILERILEQNLPEQDKNKYLKKLEELSPSKKRR